MGGSADHEPQAETFRSGPAAGDTVHSMIEENGVETAPDAAVAIVTNPAGEVLLQLRDDLENITHPGRWSLPGGAIEPGEDPVTAVLRELAEETGIRLTWARALFQVTDEVKVGGSGHRISVFHVTHPAPASDLVLGEGQELRYFPFRLLPHSLPPFVREAIDRFLAETTSRTL
jgi:8-oxo-dGTP pyrophosphatase MutT (NUDIX family)